MKDSNNSNKDKVLGDYQHLLERFSFEPEDLLIHLKPPQLRRSAAMALSKRGLSQRAIAIKLNVSRRTVRGYLNQPSNA